MLDKKSELTLKNRPEHLLEKIVLFMPVLIGMLICAVGLILTINIPELKNFGQTIMAFGICFAGYLFFDEKKHQEFVRKMEIDIKTVKTAMLKKS